MRPPPAPAPHGRSISWYFTPTTVSSRRCSTKKPRVVSRAATASSTCSTWPMRITTAEMWELVLPLVEPFIISGGAIKERRSLVVILKDDAGHAGYGESPPFDLPFYSEETLSSAADLIGRVLLPRVVGREFASPEAVDDVLRENVRGNPFARAGIETAAWDLEAHRRGTGLPQLVAERLGVAPAARFPCGVAHGMTED